MSRVRKMRRTKCAICGKDVAVLPTGKVRSHNRPATLDPRRGWCSGTGATA